MGGAQVNQYRKHYICTHQKPDFSLFIHQTQNWMKDIDDNKYISSLTLPGTHQSLARQGGYAKIITVAQCQSWSIEDQLKGGIRVFDFRGKCKKNKFQAYHGIVDQNLDVKSVFPQIYKFLDENPSEFIILFIKEEDKNTKCKTITDRFDQMISVEEKQKYWMFSEFIPKVKEVRGKIFFIPRWNYNKGYSFKQIVMQDNYNIDPKEKLVDIEKFRLQSLQNQQIDQGDHFIMNFLSGATTTNWPEEYAIKGNSQFYYNHLSKGIIMIDFPGEALIDKIIGNNFIHEDVFQKYHSCEQTAKQRAIINKKNLHLHVIQDPFLEKKKQQNKWSCCFKTRGGPKLNKNNSLSDLNKNQIEIDNNDLNQELNNSSFLKNSEDSSIEISNQKILIDQLNKQDEINERPQKK